MGFSEPSELGYKQTCLYTQGDRFSILNFDDVMFEWQEFFNLAKYGANDEKQ